MSWGLIVRIRLVSVRFRPEGLYPSNSRARDSSRVRHCSESLSRSSLSLWSLPPLERRWRVGALPTGGRKNGCRSGWLPVLGKESCCWLGRLESWRWGAGASKCGSWSIDGKTEKEQGYWFCSATRLMNGNATIWVKGISSQREHKLSGKWGDWLSAECTETRNYVTGITCGSSGQEKLRARSEQTWDIEKDVAQLLPLVDLDPAPESSAATLDGQI